MEKSKMLKLNLACGQQPLEGFVGVDIAPCEGVDVIHDLTVTPYPFEDDSVDEIFCSHFIEHLTGDQMIVFMDEIYRIMKPNATAVLLAPYYSSMRAIQDPTHKSFISEANFLYYNKQWRDQNKLDHYGIKCNFDYSYAYHMDPTWAMREESARAFALRYYINVVNDIQINLTKK